LVGGPRGLRQGKLAPKRMLGDAQQLEKNIRGRFMGFNLLLEGEKGFQRQGGESGGLWKLPECTIAYWETEKAKEKREKGSFSKDGGVLSDLGNTRSSGDRIRAKAKEGKGGDL